MTVSVRDTMKHASIYSSAALLGKMIGFVMLPFYAHILRENGYAVIGLLDAGMALLSTMLAYGVRGANVLFYHEKKDPLDKKAVISTSVIGILAVTSVLVVPLIVLSRPIAGLLLDDANLNHLLIMSLIGFVFSMGGQGASSWLFIRSQSVKFVAINLFNLVVGLSLNIWLILVRDMGLNGFFISGLATSILGNSVLMYFAFRDCGTRFDRKIALEIARFLAPLVPGNLVTFASRQAERFLLKFQIGLSSVGILEMGYKFPILIAQFITTPFQQSWNTRRFEIADEPGADQRIGEMFTYFLFLLCFAGLVMAIVIKPVLVILTPPEFSFAYRIARVEIVTLILNGVYFQLAFGLYYAKRTHVLALIRGWTSVVKVGLSWLFIAMWGLGGAAWSAAIIGAVVVGISFRLAQREYRIHMEWSKILAIVGLALGMFVWLSRWDVTDMGAYRVLEGHWLPTLNDAIAHSPVGGWKDGKIPVILAERSAPVTEILIKGALSAVYGLLILFVHTGTRQKIVLWLRNHGGF